MGWIVIPGATKDDVVRELLDQYCPVDYELCDDILWAVVTEEVLNQNLILAFLLQPPSGGWGYKILEESAHPFYYDCPLRLLKIAPVTCQEWRTKVRVYYAARTSRG
jgi:hypothetical protein